MSKVRTDPFPSIKKEECRMKNGQRPEDRSEPIRMLSGRKGRAVLDPFLDATDGMDERGGPRMHRDEFSFGSGVWGLGGAGVQLNPGFPNKLHRRELVTYTGAA